MLVRPAGEVAVVDLSGAPIADARVILVRLEVEPHLVAMPKNRWEFTTDATGFVRVAHETGTETSYPLLPHGVGSDAWHVCVEAPGHRSALTGWMIAAAPPGLTWEEYLVQGPSRGELRVPLSPGPSTPCDAIVGQHEPRPGEVFSFGEEIPVLPPSLAGSGHPASGHAGAPSTLQVSGSELRCETWGRW